MSNMGGYYPDDTQPWHLCIMEGCNYGDGGICKNCGQRLRCYFCKCFISVAGIDAHMAKKHPLPCGNEDCEGCDVCMERV